MNRRALLFLYVERTLARPLMRKAPGRPLRNARSATGRFVAYAPSSDFPFLEEMRNRAFPIGLPGAFRRGLSSFALHEKGRRL